MGIVGRGERFALLSVLLGGLVTACGTPTPAFHTQQLVPLGAYGLGTVASALGGEVAAAVSGVQPITTNIVGTSPWLGFPAAGMLGVAPLTPWPTFAPNIGTASVLNAQLGYILGSGPLVGTFGGPALFGTSLLGLTAPGGILGYGGMPFLTGGIGVPAAGLGVGGLAVGGVPGMGMGMPGMGMGMPPMGMQAPNGQPVQQQVQPSQVRQTQPGQQAMSSAAQQSAMAASQPQAAAAP